jgi:hypothetical protein
VERDATECDGRRRTRHRAVDRGRGGSKGVRARGFKCGAALSSGHFFLFRAREWRERLSAVDEACAG